MLGFYSTLQHVSAVYISHHHVDTGLQKDKKGDASPNKQWCKLADIMKQ
jgi:hypothetical protein